MTLLRVDAADHAAPWHAFVNATSGRQAYGRTFWPADRSAHRASGIVAFRVLGQRDLRHLAFFTMFVRAGIPTQPSARDVL